MIEIGNNTHPETFFKGKKELIPTSRLTLLYKVAKVIAEELNTNGIVNINFICTHNSRRSQIAQVWTFFATYYFKLDNIFAYSGGTEVTAFHRNTVKVLQQTGFKFNVLDFSHQNPRYLISFDGTDKYILGFSKIYDHEENQSPFLVITTCDSAEKKCPNIEAQHRFSIPFEDPKSMDYTNFQMEKYSEINIAICNEIYIIFERVVLLIER